MLPSEGYHTCQRSTVSTVQFVDVPEVMKTMRRRRSRQALGRFGPDTTTIISLFFRFSLVRLRQICKHYKSVELTIFLFIIGTYFHKQIDKSNSSQQFNSLKQSDIFENSAETIIPEDITMQAV